MNETIAKAAAFIKGTAAITSPPELDKALDIIADLLDIVESCQFLPTCGLAIPVGTEVKPYKSCRRDPKPAEPVT